MASATPDCLANTPYFWTVCKRLCSLTNSRAGTAGQQELQFLSTVMLHHEQERVPGPALPGRGNFFQKHSEILLPHGTLAQYPQV